MSTASWVYRRTCKENWPPSFEGFVGFRTTCLDKMADKGSDSGEEEDPTIAEDVVVTKYKMAGDMANRK